MTDEPLADIDYGSLAEIKDLSERLAQADHNHDLALVKIEEFQSELQRARTVSANRLRRAQDAELRETSLIAWAGELVKAGNDLVRMLDWHLCQTPCDGCAEKSERWKRVAEGDRADEDESE